MKSYMLHVDLFWDIFFIFSQSLPSFAYGDF